MAVLGRGWRESVRRALLEGTVISLFVAGALTAVTIRIDDRRSARERVESLEQQWRSLLVKDAVYPRALLRDLDLHRIYAPNVSLVAADLSGADLSDAALAGARLDGITGHKADFSRAQLYDAVLAGASLKNSSFNGAQLTGADLQGAVVDGVDFTDANFFHSDLRSVDLREAKLQGAYTRYTCFDDSTLWPPSQRPDTAFCQADPKSEPLSGASGLITASLLDEIKPQGQTQLYTKNLQLRDRLFVLSVHFENRGVAPLQDIVLLTEMPLGLSVVRGSINVFNSNNPTGLSASDDAIQGQQVHIGIGDYAGGGNAFVEMEVDASNARCGQRFEIKTYATPRRLGTIVDGVSMEMIC